jgi:hypothetical protein
MKVATVTNCPGLIPNKVGFFRSKIKHDRRMAPRSKLFISARKLQEQKPQPYKTVQGLRLGEDGFCALVTMQYRRTMQTSYFF